MKPDSKLKKNSFFLRLLHIVHSVRFRLMLWSTGTLAVMLVVFAAFIYSRQAADMRSAVINQVNLQLQKVSGDYKQNGMVYNSNGELTLPDAIISQMQQADNQDLVVALLSSSSRIVQKVGNISDQDLARLATIWLKNPGQTKAINVSLPNVNQKALTGYEFVVISFPVVRDSAGMLLAGLPVDPEGKLSTLIINLSLGSVGLLAITLVVGFWLGGRVLNPMQQIIRAAQRISETDLSLRLNMHTQDELSELAGTFDQMLARLQAAFDRQRQFTADASHELRTPLSIIGVESEHALDHPRTPEEYQQALISIRHEYELMTRLVNNLLTLARVDAGDIRLAFETLDLSDLALEVVDRVDTLAIENNVQVEAGNFPEVFVEGDRQYLGQMITNLLENGIKYSAGQKRCVWIDAGYNPAQKQAWLSVQDNGPGIPAEHLQHIFERFYRVDKARARSGASATGINGSGLGLSIVKWIAQAHGGSVSVLSEVGEGSTFKVFLPTNQPNSH